MSEKCVQWTELLRQPDIPLNFSEEEIYRAACIGAVMLLYEAGDAATLADTVRHAAAPESRVRALLALENLTRSAESLRGTAVHLLHELAVLDGIPNAAGFLQKSGLKDADPGWNSALLLCFGQKHQLLKLDPGPEQLSALFLTSGPALRIRLLNLAEKVIPNWTLLMRFLDEPSAENREKVLDRFHSFSPDERRLVRYCAQSGNSAVSSIAADLLLRYEDEVLLELCVKNQLLPSDPSRLALYFFLSSQWDRYYASDSDYRVIRIAYESNDPALQHRLIAVSRDSGNSGWLRDINGNTDNVPHGSSLSDRHLFAASLAAEKQWSRLWELLPNLPLLSMPSALDALRNAPFVPEQADERAFFEELCAKAAACKDLSPIPVHERLCENSGTAVSVCGGGNFTAAVFSDRRILVWDKRSPGSEPFRITSNHQSFRKAVISHDGKYLCADCGSDGITVFTLPGGQSVKTISFPGLPVADFFLQADDRRLITVGRSGAGHVFSFPGGAELTHFDIGLKDCSRASYDEQTNHLAGISMDGSCAVYDIGGNRPLSGAKISSQILAAAGVYSKNRLAMVTSGESFSLINLHSGKYIYENLSAGGMAPRRVIPISDGELYVMGTLDGRVCVFDPAVGAVQAVLSLGSKAAVTGLWYDEKEALLYGCNASGSVRCWDFGLFREMTRVFSLMDLPGLNRINEFVKKYPEPGVKAASEWLKTVVEWRRRFDIELDFD